MPDSLRPLGAALLYWAMIFTLAFAFGAFRVSWLAPRTGTVAAVLIELPLILGASFIAARAIVPRFSIQTSRAALAMGALAFAVLLAAECALAVLAFGQSAAEWAAGLVTRPGILGLLGQLGFALMPWMIVRQRAAADCKPRHFP